MRARVLEIEKLRLILSLPRTRFLSCSRNKRLLRSIQGSGYISYRAAWFNYFRRVVDVVRSSIADMHDVWNEAQWKKEKEGKKCVARIDALISRNDASVLRSLACCKKHRSIKAWKHRTSQSDSWAKYTRPMKRFASEIITGIFKKNKARKKAWLQARDISISSLVFPRRTTNERTRSLWAFDGFLSPSLRGFVARTELHRMDGYVITVSFRPLPLKITFVQTLIKITYSYIYVRVCIYTYVERKYISL